MTEIYRFIFEQLTSQLTFALDPLSEYIIFALIGRVAYVLAYRFVGDLYWLDIIDGRFAGSSIHWVVRFIFTVIFWAIGCVGLWICRFVAGHWMMLLMTLGTVMVLATVIIFMMQYAEDGK